MSMPGQFDPPPPKSGGTSVLKIVLIVLAVMLVVCGGLCAGCLVIVNKAGTAFKAGLESIQLSPAYAKALESAQENEAVVARLGEPITTDVGENIQWPYKRQGQGNLNPAGETLQFDIKGPKGKAVVTVVAKAGPEGMYQASRITVMFEDTSSIEVPPKTETDSDTPSPEKAE
jgi:hypothetical protein